MQSLEKKSKIFVMSTTRSASNGAKKIQKNQICLIVGFVTKNQDKDNFLETPCSKVNDLLCTTEDYKIFCVLQCSKFTSI